MGALFIFALIATTVYANNGISEDFFTGNNGIKAAEAASPMWHMASGSCLPGAAEDGQGHQTNGVDISVVLCGINQNQAGGCADSTYRGPNWPYANIPGEPFQQIPTYYKVAYCPGDDSWRVSYHVYFKHDVSHKSDFEWAVVKFTKQSDGLWYRYGLLMETDGDYGVGFWNDVPSTFDSTDDQMQDGNKQRNHAKLYFGKRSHSVHYDMESRNKNTCIKPDFRANDFQFWSLYNLRHESVIDFAWTYGQASNPRSVDICDNKGHTF
ncbi:uncharacterized protein ALTATR162_LOCUS5026 [Alternaria atra]|uniref:Uncharacterized protein n=1 Tax=Alternaria atra TaxID=119953 RepID=A0A8J2I0W0_9PLEO|nr:uncharacterized protein ALTATR162_LOCUS5026 [Alternaria atra]CAG5158182.1 unnamed protein product [Alternaria atra]